MGETAQKSERQTHTHIHTQRQTVYTICNDPLLDSDHHHVQICQHALHHAHVCIFTFFALLFLSPVLRPNSCVTITPDPELAMSNCRLPLLCLSLHLSIRDMSFTMPPITSRSQEAHLTSHSPCPLFLNEGHMRCGRHRSCTHTCMPMCTNKPVVMLGCVDSMSISDVVTLCCACVCVCESLCVSGH